MADRRVRRTQHALQTALVRLLQEKELSSITVKELCCAADVNKSTFYLHYRDIYDCASCLNENVIEKMTALLTPYTRQQMREELPQLMSEALELYRSNSELIGPFLKSPSLAPVTHGIRSAVTQRAQHMGSEAEYDDPGFRACVAFTVAGLFGLVEQLPDEDLNEQTLSCVVDMIRVGFLNRIPKKSAAT